MEDEIDLRPILFAVARRWPLLVACAMALAGLSIVFGLLAPRSSIAQADLFIFPRNPELSLDPRFTDRDATMVTNPVFQRQALVDLGRSSALETIVAEQLGQELTRPGELLGRITVSATSDLVRVIALAPTQAEATALAEAWADAYQDLVGELYSGAAAQSEKIVADLAEAQQQFDGVQVEIDSFYADGDLVKATQQVQRLEGLLEGGIAAQVSLYTQYLTRTQELSLILEDARALQAQYLASGDADLGAGLSALVVRARLAGADELPIQLSFDSAESFAQGQAAAANLERFVTSLATERDRMVAQADSLARDLAAGNTAAVGLALEDRTSYEQELAVARGALARAQGEEELLLQRRELALSSLEVLQSRADELRIDQSVAQVTLRLVGVAPVQPAGILVRLLVGASAAAIVGLFLGIALALFLEFGRGGRRSAALKAPAGEVVGRPSASD